MTITRIDILEGSMDSLNVINDARKVKDLVNQRLAGLENGGFTIQAVQFLQLEVASRMLWYKVIITFSRR